MPEQLENRMVVDSEWDVLEGRWYPGSSKRRNRERIAYELAELQDMEGEEDNE